MSTNKNIRNFCIIAHIDHGKSTLADRLIEYTGSLSSREMKSQVLDSMDLERERGITIKAQTATMEYVYKGQSYQLNLIDTPGHVDFSYEVSRSLAACEGALVIVDASQGVEAQTVANVNLAEVHGLKLIPVINKIDLPSARPEEVSGEIEDELAIDSDDVVLASAKTGVGIEKILEAIINKIPSPKQVLDLPLRALIFDSWFDPYLGAVSLVKVVSGIVNKTTKIQMMSTQKTYEILKLGKLTPKLREVKQLSCGEVGVIAGSIKTISDTRVGDTVTDANNPATEALKGFEEARQMVFGGVFPIDASDYQSLKDNLEKLKLNDASLTTEVETSNALGYGFRVGFLGLLHMDIIQERLEREYNLDLIFTAPSVVYHVYQLDKKKLVIDNPAKLPDPSKIDRIEEPYVSLTVHTPEDYIGGLLKLLQERRGIQKEIIYHSNKRVVIVYEIPMSEIIYDMHDKIKSISRGYASMDYEILEYRKGDLAKLDILVNGVSVDALSSIVHRQYAAYRGRIFCKKLKDILQRHMFQIAIQASIGSKILARETLSAMRKDVTAKCYGGEIYQGRESYLKNKKQVKRE